MPKRLSLRPLTEEELRVLTRLAHARTEPARSVERAQIVWRAHQGEGVPAIARALGRSEATIRLWVTRFHAQGVDGLRDHVTHLLRDVDRRPAGARAIAQSIHAG